MNAKINLNDNYQNMNEHELQIVKFLEQSYCGAKMMGDESCKIRLSRAISAFEADINEDISDK